MTANLVTGLSPMQELKSNAVAGVNPASGTDFSNVLKNSTDKGNDVNVPQPKEPAKKTQATEAKEENPKAEVKADDAKDVSNKPVKTDDTNKVTDKPEEEPISDEAMEDITAAIATMVQTIADVLEVPVAQVEEAIEALDMVDMEVLDPNTIPDLVVEITDATDVTEIMTDEDLFADVKQLKAEAENLLDETAKDLQIPVEDLKSQIGHAVAEVKASEDKVTFEAVRPTQDETDDREVKITVRQETDPTVTATDSEEIAPVSARHEDNRKQDNGNSRNDNGGHLNFTQTVTDTLKGMVAEKIDETVPSYATTTDRIMEQVSESLRMTMTEDITEMEMQLHPASLGNVRVQVAAKDGVITASFTTENEQVKEVLEAQIIQLKDQMNEQGIKVEAVEVTVSAHAFERNLSDNGQNRGEQPETEAKRKRVRGINLDGGIEDIEELDEEDQVTADMMRRQGNTVDYMA